MTTVNSRRQASLAGMAKIAAVGPPGNIVIVAGTAELAIDDVGHGDKIRPDPHLEAKFSVADLAAKADAMEPVGKDHRAHAFLFRIAIEHHVGVLGPGLRNSPQQAQAEKQQRQEPQHHGPSFLGW